MFGPAEGHPVVWRLGGSRTPFAEGVIQRVRYISTRGAAPELNFDEVLLAGLARDGGLYLPKTWPKFSPDEIAGFRDKPFADVAVAVIRPFVGDCLSDAELHAMCQDAYGTFGHGDVTPVVPLGEELWALELFHGPTLAFKDVAMQFLARAMDHVLAKRGARATIVGATSGDTGGAAIEAFRHSERADVFILYPDGRVSDVQRRMMTTPREQNVHALAVDGNFDDCQALVKAMFNDHAFRDEVDLSGVNSINWARIMAQISYYFVASVALGGPEKRLSFAVPTGNFGDIFAGWAAKQMGLPIDTLIIASNTNNILPRMLDTGRYEMRDVTATSSPSMDIQISSNFERYLFEISGREAGVVTNAMSDLTNDGAFALGALHAKMTDEFSGFWASEEDVATAVKTVNEGANYVLDPHTACGFVAATRWQAAVHKPVVVLATAHPAKFPDAIEKITGERPDLPDRLSRLMTDEERSPKLSNDLGAVEAYVRTHRKGGAAA